MEHAAVSDGAGWVKLSSRVTSADIGYWKMAVFNVCLLSDVPLRK
jgi:hypothetical protein